MRPQRTAAWLLLALSASAPAFAQDPVADPSGFVREVARVELAANADPVPHWRYRLEKRNASGTSVREIVETKQGLIGRLLSLNGKPLSQQVERDERARLLQLRNDPAQLSKKFAGQERDRQRVMKMIRALPQAFLYSYQASSSGPFGDEVTLAFRPNPHFSPDGIETEIFRSMAGTLRIARQQKRLIELRGTLIDDVNIGLGIVAKIAKGGTLELTQAQIAPGSWEVAVLDLNVTGRALFHHLDVSVYEKASDFQPVSSDLTVAQAIDMLLASDKATLPRAADAPQQH